MKLSAKWNCTEVVPTVTIWHIGNRSAVRFAAWIAPHDADRAVAILREHTPEIQPALIGTVENIDRPLVTITSPFGSRRVLDLLSGDQLPRIC